MLPRKRLHRETAPTRLSKRWRLLSCRGSCMVGWMTFAWSGPSLREANLSGTKGSAAGFGLRAKPPFSFENPSLSLVLTTPLGIHGRPVLVNAWSCGESNAISTGSEGEVVVLLNQYQNVYGGPPLFLPPLPPIPSSARLPSSCLHRFMMTPCTEECDSLFFHHRQQHSLWQCQDHGFDGQGAHLRHDPRRRHRGPGGRSPRLCVGRRSMRSVCRGGYRTRGRHRDWQGEGKPALSSAL